MASPQRCLECVSDHLSAAPMQENAVQDMVNALSDGSDDDDSDDTGSFITNRYGNGSGAQGLSSVRGSKADRAMDTPRKAGSATSNGHEVAGNNGVSSRRSNGGHAFTGYDSQGQAHQLARLESSVGSECSYTDTIRSARPANRAQSAFAKTKETGKRGVPHIRPAPYHGGRNVTYESDSEPDSDFGTI
ncbi:MAG: hypothetical protein Q9163_001557 [Psora crenata]